MADVYNPSDWELQCGHCGCNPQYCPCRPYWPTYIFVGVVQKKVAEEVALGEVGGMARVKEEQ